MNARDAANQIHEVQRRIQKARDAVREIIQRQQERLEHNRRFLDQLRD